MDHLLVYSFYIFYNYVMVWNTSSGLKNTIKETTNEPSEVKVNIVTTRDELDRLNKVNAYEKEHNVKILWKNLINQTLLSLGLWKSYFFLLY